MSLTRSWQSAINDVLTGPMIMNILKRYPFLEKLMEKKDWIGTGETVTTPSGPRNSYIIEFLGSAVGARKVGAYQSADSIQITDPIRGMVQSYIDFTGSLKVRSQDLRQHRGKDLAKSLLGKIERQATYSMAGFKNDIEDMILNKSVISTVTSVADVASGNLTVARPEKFEIGQSVQLAASGATTKGQELFVIAVNKNTKVVQFSTSLAGSASDLTNYVGTAALTYICVNGTVSSSTGLASSGLDSLKSILLSSTNGGDASYLGKTKTAYPFLQAAEVDGSTMTGANFLKDLFEYYSTDIQLRVRHPEGIKPKDVLLSPLNYAIALINLENYKGQFYKNDSPKANPYGWDSIQVGTSSSGADLTLHRVESMTDDFIPVLNLDTLALVTNGGIQFENDENNRGNEKYWYPTRATTGYTWICDYVMSGQFVCGNPESNGAFYSVSMSI